jgi:hypothetical protein
VCESSEGLDFGFRSLDFLVGLRRIGFRISDFPKGVDLSSPYIRMPLFRGLGKAPGSAVPLETGVIILASKESRFFSKSFFRNIARIVQTDPGSAEMARSSQGSGKSSERGVRTGRRAG